MVNGQHPAVSSDLVELDTAKDTLETQTFRFRAEPKTMNSKGMKTFLSICLA